MFQEGCPEGRARVARVRATAGKAGGSMTLRSSRVRWLFAIVCMAVGRADVAGATGVTLLPDRVAPQPVGTTVTWTATANGGTAPYSFKWWLHDGSSWRVLRDWNASAVFDWSPTTAQQRISRRRVGAQRRQDLDVDEANEGVNFAIMPASSRVTSVSLAADHPAPQPAGSTITWSAEGVGGVGPHSFKWWLYDGSTWKVLRDWNPSASFSWTPATPNRAYRMGVWVRSAGNSSDADEANQGVNFAITAANAAASRVSSLTLVPDRASPQALGTAVTWTATPAGGSAPYTFKWWRVRRRHVDDG